MTSIPNDKTRRVLALPKDFSGYTVDSFRTEFEQLAVCEQDFIVLDFSETEFIDSSGIGAMVFLYKRIEQKGQQLALLKVNGQPHKLMNLLRVDKTIPFIDKLDA
ncbi:STAS domain-containing protein [Pseudoalteromonas sp. S16_S37]|nr:STAS domain-containing protein [Pseudoalteromonas sp. S16_S37]